MIDCKNLPLFEWTPVCRLIVFPPEKQVGKIREIAQTWLGQRSSKKADEYALQVDDDLQDRFSQLGVLPDERKRLTDQFWRAVRGEIARLRHVHSKPGGSAA